MVQSTGSERTFFLLPCVTTRYLMTKLLSNIALAAVAGILITACTDTTGNVANSGSSVNAKPPVAKPAAKSTDYPPLPTAVADAEFEMIDGTKSKISDRKGKVLLINLWATWCGPCRAEMPHLVEMQNMYGDKGFQVLGLDIGNNDGQPERIEDIERFAAAMKLNYELARISGELVGKFNRVSNFNAVPQSYLVDREGRLRGVFLGGGSDVINKMKQTTAAVMAE